MPAAPPGPITAALVSRVLAWAAGIGAYLAYGATGGSLELHADPTNATQRLGSVGNVLAAPFYRWDSLYYVEIAEHGYTRLKVAGFFPLYPVLLRGVDLVVGAPVIAGALVSLAAFVAALVLLARLAELELGDRAPAHRAVWLLALFPTAIFFSAVYTEGLFLLCTVGAFYCARQGRWALAGAVGLAAALTRNVGLVILLPVALLYLYGPRADRPPDRPTPARWYVPRYRLRPNVLFLLLVPLGTAIFMGAMWATFDDPLAPWTSQNEFFRRSFYGPYAGVPLGVWEAIKAVGHAASGDIGLASLGQKVGLVVAALGALVAGVWMLRDLPVAYGAYVLAVLLAPLSTPASVGPLNGSPRYVAAAFPLFIWLGMKVERRTWFLALCAVFALGLVYCSARLATWHFVA